MVQVDQPLPLGPLSCAAQKAAAELMRNQQKRSCPSRAVKLALSAKTCQLPRTIVSAENRWPRLTNIPSLGKTVYLASQAASIGENRRTVTPTASLRRRARLTGNWCSLNRTVFHLFVSRRCLPFRYAHRTETMISLRNDKSPPENPRRFEPPTPHPRCQKAREATVPCCLPIRLFFQLRW